MQRKTNVVLGFLFGALLSGCNAENSTDFVGHWVEVNGTDSKPMTLDISYEDRVFHIDEKKTIFGKDFESKVEGKADSATTISAKGGALSMRLENNRLLYKGRELIKSP
ncbi:hypothetical protein [Pseudomonas chlororaphis]|uniref:hypothetical protein n=1 Tax=Pseudomonas chlororaphis TaxID=587753 RepID=UPI002D7A26A8|nr:hypothetical protein [Pseudomonas chlororaphis]